MDKQQATNLILTRLRVGFGREEIVEELCRTLKAPAEIIEQFVAQVISTHPDAVAHSPTDTDSHGGTEPLTIQAKANQAQSFSPFADSDLPPGLIAILDDSSTNLETFLAKSSEPVPMSNTQSSPDFPLPKLANLEEPGEKTINADGDYDAISIDRAALSEFIFKQFKKQRRHSDIVQAVCHKTGWHWNKSQRFVARVQTKHLEELQSGKNRIIILLGIVFILAGLIMVLNSANTISDYVKLAALAQTNPDVLLNVSLQSTIYSLAAMVTGIGMIVGGGFGITRTLLNR